jgi:ABC-type nitrate/sulfonate/bicarbonate transport system substrate-binding protein
MIRLQIPPRWVLIVGLPAGLLSAAPLSAQGKIRIGLPVPNYAPYVPLLAAQDLGIYSKNGTAAEFTTYRGGPAAQEGLAAGSADMIIAAPAQAAIAIEKGVKQKIVGVFTLSAQGWHIVVRTDSDIKSVKDLGGKTVAVTAAGSLNHINLLWATQQAGVTAKAIPVGPTGLIPALRAKQVDAASMQSPLPYRLMLTGEVRSIFDVGKDMPPAIPEVWVVSQRLLDDNPKGIAAVMLSGYEAVAYLSHNRTQSLDYIKKYTDETDEKIVAFENDVIIAGMPTAAKIDRKWLDFAFNLGKLSGIQSLPSIEQSYTEQFSSVKAP